MPAISFGDDGRPGTPFSVATAIALGLIASFIQSLGLTIQRKSHLLNESLAPARRKTEWKRPLWLAGFAIFLVANIGGTVFQIGALPIVMLAPLGAVSLLYNAVLARFLLNDLLSKYMVMGTALIASGAVLIGYFGVVPSPPHSLDELLDLYARPTFVAFATIFTFLFVGVLAISHLAEWQLDTRVYRNSLPPRPQKPKHRANHGVRGRLRRRWSAPTLAPVAEVSESSSGIATPVLAVRDEANRRSSLVPGPQQNVLYGRSIVATPMPPLSSNMTDPHNGISSARSIPPRSGHSDNTSTSKRDYGSLGRSDLNSRKRKKGVDVPRLELREAEQRIDVEAVKQTKLGLAVAYGGASGTLSGACLLLAKSGVELLMLTFAGHNQFGRWQSWLLIGILLAAALLQLWYLNKALKLADPTLVCPLAFCFYNTASIALGLVYFDQIGALAWYDILFVAIGTAVLLGGVWTVSLHGNDDACDDSIGCEERETQPLLASPDRSRSRSEADQEGLLVANAAGVAGPHLPPVSKVPHSSSFVEHHVARSLSPEEAPLAMDGGYEQLAHYQHSTSLCNNLQLGAPPSKRRLGSTSTHSHRRPTITLEFPLRDDLFSPNPDTGFESARDVEAQASASASPSAHRSPDAPHSDHEGASTSRRKPSLYNSILEHGLSIGISPSSPGFHLQPRSPSLSRNHSHWQHHTSRHPQRSMSEAEPPTTITGSRRTRSGGNGQAGSDNSTNYNGSEEPPAAEDTEDNAGSSGFGIMLDQIDLSRRLEAVGISKSNGRKWWSRFRPKWRGERDGARSGEAEPLIEEEACADTSGEGTVIVTSNSNGSLMAAPSSAAAQQTPQGLGLTLDQEASSPSDGRQN